jgi:hypothetical protein
MFTERNSGFPVRFEGIRECNFLSINYLYPVTSPERKRAGSPRAIRGFPRLVA